jgi:formylglycine-generating enzyme required for sulfatase activity
MAHKLRVEFVYKDQGPATGCFNDLHPESNFLTINKMSKHIFSRRGAAKAFLFFTFGVIVVGAAPAVPEGALDKDPVSQELRKKFAAWRGERDAVEKKQQDYYQQGNRQKQQEQHRNFLPGQQQGQQDGNQGDFDNIMPAPNDPELWPLWRDWLTQWRKDQRAALGYDDSYYSHEAFAWVSSNYVSCFAMLWDLTLYDPSAGKYTVDAFVEHGRKEFGGYDSLVLWHAYPQIGFDDRNQFDYYRDMPGGLEGLRDLTRALHQKGIKVFIDYNPWDSGTRREGKSHADLLVELVNAIDADGVYLDTWHDGTALRAKLDAVRPGLVLDTEMPIPLRNIAEHHMSWGQSKTWRTWEFEDSHAPGVLKSKWFERRHVVRPTNRWIKDRTGELHVAWMNGTGTLVWENVFGVWNGWDARARSMLRSMLPIQRRYVDLFSGNGWTPLVEHRGDKVFASLWEGGGLKLWTLVNRADEPYGGNLLAVPHTQGTRYFDLIMGVEIKAAIKESVAFIDGKMDARGIGGFLALPEKAVTKDLDRFLRGQAGIFSRRDPDARAAARNHVLKPISRTRKYDKDNLPQAMAAIDGGMVELDVVFLGGGGRPLGPVGFHDEIPKKRKLELSPYAIDVTPVTNKQYAEFLRASGYKPRHGENFLKHWIDGKPPAGKEDHPVVYVDLDDARAYAQWAGKRLPTEEEWQYAAEGPEHLKYPWGNQWQSGVCNDGKSKGTTSVYEYPGGRSPFGCHDMCGNTWAWTESERSDGRTRSCLLRGGSFFKAGGSEWYPAGGPVPCNGAAKFLLMWPGLDRCSTIGFRCVVDVRPIQ